MIDIEVLDTWKAHLADRYTAAELVEELDLDVWDIIEMFSEKILEFKERD